MLFGGGVKKLVRTIQSMPLNQVLQSQTSTASDGGGLTGIGMVSGGTTTPGGPGSNLPGGEQIMSTLSSLQKTR